MTELHIRNMVCARCIKSVASIFERMSINVQSIELGVVKLGASIDEKQLSQLRSELHEEGFEILDDQKTKLAGEIRRAIIELVHYGELDDMQENLSVYLSKKLQREYSHLSHIFSTVENITVEQYFILQKIEKVKEWLVYNEYTLGEIAYKLGYSSTAHLSAQFKKITGFTPSKFRLLKDHSRKELDKI